MPSLLVTFPLSQPLSGVLEGPLELVCKGIKDLHISLVEVVHQLVQCDPAGVRMHSSSAQAQGHKRSKAAANGGKRRATGNSQWAIINLVPSRRVDLRRPTSRAPLHLERLDVLRDHTTRADRAGMDLPTSESIGPVDPVLIRRIYERQGERWGKAEAGEEQAECSAEAAEWVRVR